LNRLQLVKRKSSLAGLVVASDEQEINFEKLGKFKWRLSQATSSLVFK
jgi:hypothetical protein